MPRATTGRHILAPGLAVLLLLVVPDLGLRVQAADEPTYAVSQAYLAPGTTGGACLLDAEAPSLGGACFFGIPDGLGGSDLEIIVDDAFVSGLLAARVWVEGIGTWTICMHEVVYIGGGYPPGAGRVGVQLYDAASSRLLCGLENEATGVTTGVLTLRLWRSD